MSTNSHIGFKADLGKDHYHYTYCHWDGYPSHVGRILYDHYNTLDKVVHLVAGGYISSLGKSIECPKGHSFETPVEGFTIYYGRDRGDSDVGTMHARSLNKTLGQEYVYMFIDGQWMVNDHGQGWVELTKYRNDDGTFRDDV
jgi:hypothetical protein